MSKKFESKMVKKLTVPYGQSDLEYDFIDDAVRLRSLDGDVCMFLGTFETFCSLMTFFMQEVQKREEEE